MKSTPAITDFLTVVECRKCSKYSKGCNLCDHCQAQIPANASKFHVARVSKEELSGGLFIEQRTVTKTLEETMTFRAQLDKTQNQNCKFHKVVPVGLRVLHKRRNSGSLVRKAKGVRTAERTYCTSSSGEEKSKIIKSGHHNNSSILPDVSTLSLGNGKSKKSESGPSSNLNIVLDLSALSLSKEESVLTSKSAPKVVVPSKPLASKKISPHKVIVSSKPPAPKKISAPEAIVPSEPSAPKVVPSKPFEPKVASSEPLAPESPKPVVKLLTYPPQPIKDRVEVTSYDLACLREENFLNDVIIEYYIKYLFWEKLSPSDRENTHLFNSFFYTRLTQDFKIQQEVGDDTSKTEKFKRYDHVKTWTRRVDIFSKDYIIIPVNMDLHWVLAIICYPNRVPNAPNVPDKEISINDEVDSIMDSSSDLPMDEGYSEKIEHSYSKEKKETPCICIFDSLSDPDQSETVITFLREYLEMEWKVKKGTPKVFNRNTMKGIIVNCPQQANKWDCGLYLLQYVESFFENPIEITNQIPDLSCWFTEEKIATKRQELRDLILRRHNEHANAASEIKIKDKNQLPTSNMQ